MTPPPAAPAEVRDYLSRIGFAGEPAPDAATLAALHRHHVEAIPWECLDVYRGRPVTRDPRAAFEKLVHGRRGGWCYEMNGLFAWMLESIGFRVTRLAAGVMRESLGDAVIGNHLALLVHLDRIWLADVGLGSGLIEPVPLAEGDYRQRFAAYRLERLGGAWWRFHNQPSAMPPSFDFSTELTDERLLEDRCRWLQSDPASPFIANAVVQRHFPDRLESLIGTRAVRLDHRGPAEIAVSDAAQYRQLLLETFGLALEDAERIWSKAAAAGPPALSAA